eukprot:CAMPEP_0179865718 /NCGR_PEP_ID=MMETSP0982-20121206/17036_1 /TAXON_ID=483367 /ORGANISM="non described non described, Strain CCMP 2436" /LENGTH=89 /DNA_ID=CAMNT_0021754529 /DNA_START=253 /DNA_END=520 /DNA_ORIENTATION=-
MVAAAAASAGLLVERFVERKGAEDLSNAVDSRRALVEAKVEPRRLKVVALGAALRIASHPDDHALKSACTQRTRRLLAGEDGHLVVHQH